jgi:hypothetical protein
MSFLAKVLSSPKIKGSYIQVRRKFDKLEKVIRAGVSPDPWALPRLLGMKLTTPILHEEDRSKPVLVPCEWGDDMKPVAILAFIIGVVPASPKCKVIEGEPLGQEDYELGLSVPPGEVDPVLQQAWLPPYGC